MNEGIHWMNMASPNITTRIEMEMMPRPWGEGVEEAGTGQKEALIKRAKVRFS